MKMFNKESNAEKFVKALETAMKLAKDIPGIKDIQWKLSYTGQKTAVCSLVEKVNAMMESVNGKPEEPAKEEEEVTTTTEG